MSQLYEVLSAVGAYVDGLGSEEREQVCHCDLAIGILSFIVLFLEFDISILRTAESRQ